MDKAITDIYDFIIEAVFYNANNDKDLKYCIMYCKKMAQGCYIADMKDEIKKTEKELIKEPEKINIDKDLQKYFNYKE